MGFVVDEFVPFHAAGFQPEAPKEDAPGLGSVVAAAGTMANWPYRSWRYLQNRDGVETDPSHDPFPMIEGTKYASDPERFAHSRNSQETQAIMSEWDQDTQALDVLARSGWTGTVAAVGMGMMDPTVFLPIAPVFSGLRSGASALRIGADVALTAGATAAVGEAAMAATTPHYTAGDAVQGIGTATLLGGLIGAGAGALLSKAERQSLTETLDGDRKAWGQDIAQANSAPMAGNAGAAASDTRELKLNTPAILAKLPDPTAKVSPPRRVLNKQFVEARRATVDLVETPYIFEGNVEGIATTQGPALDRHVKLEVGKAKVAVAEQMDTAYARYRFGEAPHGVKQAVSQKLTRMMDHTGRATDKATSHEFRQMVDDALRNNDTHDIPEVAETARMMRKTVIEPWRDRAIKAGLLPEGIDAKTADSYMMRIWNKERLIAERPRAAQIFGDWIGGEEAKKAGLQERLKALSGELDGVHEKIAALEKATVKKLGHESELIDLGLARDKLRGKIEDLIVQWDGKSAKAAKSALEKRPATNGRSVAADGEVDAALKRILSKERLTNQKDIDALAQEVIDRIVGNPDGRLPYDAPTAMQGGGGNDARGPLAARTFMIPDALVRDFIERDAQRTADIYLKTMVPDVLMTERFGDVDMSEAFRKIEDEAAALQMAAKSDGERTKIKDDYDHVVADIAAMRDRVRGTYGFSSGPSQRFMGRMCATAARYDIMTNLGGTALASLPDLAGIQWRYGLTAAFKHAWLPFAKAMLNPETRKGLLAYKEQLRSLSIAAETYLTTRNSGLNDIMDAYRPTSRFERGMHFAAEKFGLFNMLAHWTDFAKFSAGMVSGGELTRAAKALHEGKASARQIRDLAENGIDAAMASRIQAMMESDGGANMVGGMHITNSGAWRDKGAATAFEGAIARDVDIMIITPGAEKPLLMSHPVMAVILQYKSFVAAASERLLVRSIHARDRQVLQGMVSAIGLGVLAEYANNIASNRAGPQTMPDMIKAGITRSGLLGWYAEANAIGSKWTGGTADAFRLMGTTRPDSRYISRSKLGALLGPTAGKLENVLTVASDAVNLKWTSMDTERTRRFMIGQNLFYVRRLLDGLVDDANAAMGLDPIERHHPAN